MGTTFNIQNLSYRYTRGGTRKQRKIKTITGHRPMNRVTLNNKLQRSQKFTGVNNAYLITIKVHKEPPVQIFQAQCGLLNVRSIRNKSVEFKEFVEDHQLDFIALTETWLKPTDDYSIQVLSPRIYCQTYSSYNGYVWWWCCLISIQEQFRY